MKIITEWTVEDVLNIHPKLTKEQAVEFLDKITKGLEMTCKEAGQDYLTYELRGAYDID